MSNIAVTGASGGMGRAICEVLSRAGYTVFGLDIREPKLGEGETLNWEFLPMDVTSESSVGAAAAALNERGIRLRAMLQFAGIYDLNSLVEMPEEDFVRIFNVNLFGDYRVTKAFLPLLEEQGRVMLVSSELAPLMPLPFTGLYGVTKTAVEHYAQALRMELNLLGHPVTVIRPGAVETGLLNVSVTKMNRFCDETELYPIASDRFRKIVASVENRSVTPERLAKTVQKALEAKRPRYVYNLNRNFGLRLLNRLPLRWQVTIIGWILKPKKKS